MAKFKGGLGGLLSGMIGPVVVVNRKNGDIVLRSAPKERKKNSFSEKQKQNWNRFSAVTAFWKKLEPTPVQEIWQVAEEGRRGINLFINTNAHAFNSEGVIADLERLHFSAGRLPLPHKLEASRQAGDPSRVEVTWDEKTEGLARADDELMMMTAIGGEFTGPVATGVTRRQKSAVIQLPEGQLEGIYLFFASGKRKLYSGDVYFNLTV